jgi:hypothetical protein
MVTDEHTQQLLEYHQAIESQIKSHYRDIELLREKQKEVEEQLPRLYYVQGFGQQGLAARIHFAGSFEDCKVWVSHNEQLELTEDEQQIRRKDAPKAGSYPVAGMIASVTPVDNGWREISDMAELDKQVKERNRNVSE